MRSRLLGERTPHEFLRHYWQKRPLFVRRALPGFAGVVTEETLAQLAARDENRAPHLAELARLDDAAFRARFAKSPIKRTGRERFLRNVLIAIGNSGDAALAADAKRLLDDPSPLVRGAAVWALSRLLPRGEFSALAHRQIEMESDPAVIEEWRAN